MTSHSCSLVWFFFLGFISRSVAAPPVILTQPVSRVVAEGMNANMSVGLQGSASFQWRKNGVNIPGQIAVTLSSLSAVTAADAGSYDCVVTNADGVAMHPPATLTVLTNVAPVSQIPRSSRVVAPGSVMSVSAPMFGSLPMTYQWQKNGEDIPGATAVSYSVNPVTEAHAGVYRCRVTNAHGSTLSPLQYVRVARLPEVNYLGQAFTKILSQGEAIPGRTSTTRTGRFTDFENIRYRDGVLVIRAKYNSTGADYGLYHWANGTTTIIADDSVTAPGGLKFANAVYPTEAASGRVWFGASTSDSVFGLYHWTNGTLVQAVASVPGGAGQLAARGDTAFFASTFVPPGSSLTPEVRLWRRNPNGSLDVVLDRTMDLPGPFSHPSGVPGTNPQFAYDGTTLVFHQQDETGLQAIFAMPGAGGPIKEIVNSNQLVPGATTKLWPIVQVEFDGGQIFSGSLPYTVGSNVLSLGWQGSFGLDGSLIHAAATPGTVNAAGPDSFVTYNGAAFNYRRGDFTHNGSPSAQLGGQPLAKIIKADADGQDCAMIAEVGGIQTIQLAEGKKVTSAPSFVTHPNGLMVLEGANITLHAVATGGGLSWQWKKNGTNLPGMTSNSLPFTNFTAAEAGNYTVVVSNSLGSVESNTATLSLPTEPTPQPALLPFPTEFTLQPGVSWTIGPTSIEGTSYALYKGDTLITNNRNHSLNPVEIGHQGNYRYVVTNPAGSVSLNFRLNVAGGPTAEDLRPEIGPAAFRDGKIEFSMPTVNSHAYRVEFKTKLGDPNWTSVQTFNGNGGEMPFAFTISGAIGFYRVVDTTP